MCIKKIIDIKIPIIYIFTFIVFLLIFSNQHFSNMNYIIGEVLGGGLVFGAFFMATDYVTSPITSLGKIIYSIILGILTGVFRLYGKASESVSYVIILSNLLVPFIDNFVISKSFIRENN